MVHLDRWHKHDLACRYFLHTWPKLCFLAFHQDHCFGTVVCKMEPHKELMRGYIAMLVVEKAFRGLGIGEPPFAACVILLLICTSFCSTSVK